MLYYVKNNDTVSSIANEFHINPKDITNANVICDPNNLSPGDVLILPIDSTLNLPKSQASIPYYITKQGDSIACLEREFNISQKNIAYMNLIPQPYTLPTDTEILDFDFLKSPIDLNNSWQEMSQKCNSLTPEDIYNTYYIGSFSWQAIGSMALPYLLEFLNNPCEIVKYYAIVSIGRIAPKSPTIMQALTDATSDDSELVSTTAQIAIDRIKLTNRYGPKGHVSIFESKLYIDPDLSSPSIDLPSGSEVLSISWAIPSPTGEKNNQDNILLYDRVFLLTTSTEGFMPRVGSNEINVI